MMDAFFGFDTSIRQDCEDVRGGRRSVPSRCSKDDESDGEQYDALNDETFGAADKGDWEDMHENLVRLESGVREDDAASSEVDECHSRTLQLDDYELDLKLNFYDTNDESGRSSVGAQSIGDEFASKLRLDPSIWSSPLKATAQRQPQPPCGFGQAYSVQHGIPSPFQTNAAKLNQRPFATEQPITRTSSIVTPPQNMLSVEDIERNIIQQQRLKLKEHQKKLLHQQQQQKMFNAVQRQADMRNQRKQAHPTRSSKAGVHKSQPMLAAAASPLRPGVPPMLRPPQLLAARNVLLPSAAVHNHPAHVLPQAGRLPLGMLSPYGLLPLSATQLLGPMNNLAMHPAFPHAALGPHGGLHAGLVVAGTGPIVSLLQQRHQPMPAASIASTVTNNQFNQRLVQEIQQNHPLLSFNRQQQQQQQQHHGNVHHQKHNPGHHHHHHHQHQQYRSSNGMPKAGAEPTGRDAYANLMSSREKQWLIGIQLMQLNSDWPYFSDYYFTVFRERLAVHNDENHASRAHKDNQLNHPFTQPSGHAAQLHLSMASMAKGVTGGRERKSSECSRPPNGDGKEAGRRTYTPLQFENSLGKLQCGSVTAPRKIIDMDVMGSDERDVNGNSVNLEHTISQRKIRHVLLLIETLYRIVLKLEDLLNPIAMEAITLLREKRERDRATGTEGSASYRGAVASLPEHTESFDELADALIANLSQDKTTSILGVRKGKILMRRILAVLQSHPFRWSLWGMIFGAIPGLQRKDREDADGLLFNLYTEFERHVQQCETAIELMRLSKTLSTGGDAVMQYLSSCKLLLSATIMIIFQMETLYGQSSVATDKQDDESSWVAFLEHVNRMVRNESEPVLRNISVIPESNIVDTLRRHFERFDGRVDGTELINYITDNGNSIEKFANRIDH